MNTASLSNVSVREAAEISLGTKLTDEQFNLAHNKALKKQDRIYKSTRRTQVLDKFYLAELVKEAAIEAAFMQACS